MREEARAHVNTPVHLKPNRAAHGAANPCAAQLFRDLWLLFPRECSCTCAHLNSRNGIKVRAIGQRAETMTWRSL